VHKTHHEWTAPFALMACYNHPLDHIISNMLTVIAGPVILGPHPVSLWFWVAFAVFRTVNNHSGYHLPFMRSPEFHDFHHLVFNQNYGTLGLLDFFHGTDANWRQTKSRERNFVLYNLTPVRQLVPDADADCKNEKVQF